MSFVDLLQPCGTNVNVSKNDIEADVKFFKQTKQGWNKLRSVYIYPAHKYLVWSVIVAALI